MPKRQRATQSKDDYKIILSELRVSPFGVIKIAFALMGIIPLLIILYIIIGKNFLYKIFLGNSGLIAGLAILISLIGFLYAYRLVENMLKKLLAYSAERKRADEEKTEFLLAVSHDLKTPLSVIKNGMQNLLDGIGGVLSNVHQGMAKICLDAVKKMNEFIDELLKASEIQFVRMRFKREFMNFEKIVLNELDGISSLAEKNNQKLNRKLEAKNPNIWGDTQKLGRAVMNILSNAVKYTPKGGKIEAILSDDEDTVRLSILNTGPGIKLEEMDKIFKKYERLNKHAGTEGSGLGLSIAKTIVDMHKGHLTARSEPGKETEFDIVLPKDLRSKARVA